MFVVRSHMKRALLMGMLMAAIFLALLLPQQEAYAADLTDRIEITSIDILLDKSGTKAVKDQGDDPANYSSGIDLGKAVGLSFAWKMNPGSTPIEAGDTVRFTFTMANNDGSPGISHILFMNQVETPIVANNGTEIGKWTLKYTNNSIATIDFVFNDNAKTATEWAGSCNTAVNYGRGGVNNEDVVRQIIAKKMVDSSEETMKVMRYKANKTVLTPIDVIYPGGKGTPGSSNNVISWAFTPNTDAEYKISASRKEDFQNPRYASGFPAARKVTFENAEAFLNERDTHSWGDQWVEENLIEKDIYFEDTVEDAIDINGIEIRSYRFYPRGNDSTDSISCRENPGYYTLNNLFTRIDQSSDDTMDSFRNKVKSKDLQYGVYRDDNGVYTVMWNLGDFPHNDLKYTDVNAYEITSNIDTNKSPAWTDERKQMWNNTHRVDNCVSGRITSISFVFKAEYPPVVKETPKTNETIVNYDDVQDNSHRSTASNRLRPNEGSAVQTKTAELIKYDEADNTLIEGAKFKLQKLEGGSWIDVPGLTEAITDKDGKVSFSGLGAGDYRFVETEAAPNYDKDSIKYYDKSQNEITTEKHFTIADSDTEGAKIYASNTQKTVFTPVKVDPPISKTVDGIDDGDMFTYKLIAESNTAGIDVPDMPMPSGSSNGVKTITKPGAGSYEFGEFDLELPGTYVYRVVEEKGNLMYDYDPSSYKITYVVSASGATLSVNSSIEKDGAPTDAIVFTNKDLKTPVLLVEKTSEIKEASPGEEIPYTIKVTNTGDRDAKSISVVDTMDDNLSYVSDDASGTVSGQTISWVMDIPANGSKSIMVRCRIGEGASGTVNNSVKISGTGEEIIQKDRDDHEIAVNENDDSTYAEEDSDSATDEGEKDNAKKSRDGKSKSVAAGDEANLSHYTILMLAAVVALTLTRYKRRHDSRKS